MKSKIINIYIIYFVDIHIIIKYFILPINKKKKSQYINFSFIYIFFNFFFFFFCSLLNEYLKAYYIYKLNKYFKIILILLFFKIIISFNIERKII